ncbi:hypothetical protein [Arenibaculum pallidiluteum]|uniref:hypothetical protein n=1 Tax=Arenibaculum pallidiluteum TaxID=2812559 RepID=UPI001A956899|nr:hypothetical protein [Arenibaculum pallidiluteum]
MVQERVCTCGAHGGGSHGNGIRKDEPAKMAWAKPWRRLLAALGIRPDAGQLKGTMPRTECTPGEPQQRPRPDLPLVAVPPADLLGWTPLEQAQLPLGLAIRLYVLPDPHFDPAAHLVPWSQPRGVSGHVASGQAPARPHLAEIVDLAARRRHIDESRRDG